MTAALHVDEWLHLPRAAVRFPIELRPPEGFVVEDVGSWPKIEGRIEFVDGRLLYMPPCGDVQQDVCAAVTGILFAWVRQHRQFIVGSNEAGMLLGGDARGADGAVWRRADAGRRSGRFRRVAPVLAVEVAGDEQGEPELRDKARWYLDAGVEIVWLVFPMTRDVLVLTRDGERRYAEGTRVPAGPSLPGLEPEVAEFFLQLDDGRDP